MCYLVLGNIPSDFSLYACAVGVGNKADSDDDGDNVTDASDPFPLDISEVSPADPPSLVSSLGLILATGVV